MTLAQFEVQRDQIKSAERELAAERKRTAKLGAEVLSEKVSLSLTVCCLSLCFYIPFTVFFVAFYCPSCYRILLPFTAVPLCRRRRTNCRLSPWMKTMPAPSPRSSPQGRRRAVGPSPTAWATRSSAKERAEISGAAVMAAAAASTRRSTPP